MKKLLVLFYFLLTTALAYTQRQAIDSILRKITVEKDGDKKVDLIIGIWATGVDRDPYLFIKTGLALPPTSTGK